MIYYEIRKLKYTAVLLSQKRKIFCEIQISKYQSW